MLLIWVIASGAAAEQKKWKLPSLLPFMSKKAQPTAGPAARAKRRLPPVLPASHVVPDFAKLPKPRKPKTSTIDRITKSTQKLQRQTTQTLSGGAKKIGDSTKQLLDKSKQLLVPWAGSAKSSSRRGKSSRSSGARKGHGGGLWSPTKLWQSSGKQRKTDPLTMTDFLGLDRVSQ
jgi:hypothetical protein